MVGLTGTWFVPHDLYLFARHYVTGKPFLQPRALGFGLAGALLAELVLGALLTVELAMIVAETVAGLAQPAGGQMSFGALSPGDLLQHGAGTFGVLAVVAVLGSSGSSRRRCWPRRRGGPGTRSRSRPTWRWASSRGLCRGELGDGGPRGHRARGVGRRRAGPGLLSGLAGGLLSATAQFLFLTSLFAAALAFHNRIPARIAKGYQDAGSSD